MILDALLEFDAYTGVAITVTRDSTNVLDMAAFRDMGVGGENALDLLIMITQTFTAAGAATLTTSINGSTDNATYVVLATTPASPVANLIAGREILRQPLPMWSDVDGNNSPGATAPRYYKLIYTVATGPMTAGKVASYMIGKDGRDANRAYAAGFSATNI